MRVLGTLLLALNISAIEAQAQEPRLPAPAATPSESEALIQRARALSAAGSYRESAAAWQVIGTREPVISNLATRESIRAWIAAGDIEPALKGLSELGSAAPAELLLRAADSCRASASLECANRQYRRAREAAGRSAAADEAAIGLAATLEKQGMAREALETYRELQLTFRGAAAFEVADREARRLSLQLGDPEPLTESDYDSIVDRLAGVAAFRRAVDMQDERLKNFPSSPRREEIESGIVQHLYSLRANEEARSRALAFLKQHPGSLETGNVFITLFRLDVREGLSADVEKRGRAIMGGEIAGSTLSDRQGAARLLAEYLVSIGQPVKALGVYAALQDDAVTRRPRRRVVANGNRVSSRRQRGARGQRASAGAELEARFRNRACSVVLARVRAGRGGRQIAARAEWAALARLNRIPTTGCARHRAAACPCRLRR